MGMYTELHYNVSLKKETPRNIIDTLKEMLNFDDEPKPKKDLPNHVLFTLPRWKLMLQCDSYYFDSETNSTLKFDEITKHFYLNVKCNLKNYSNEIEQFVDWLNPHVDCYDGDFLGFHRYEESNTPTLIFKKGN